MSNDPILEALKGFDGKSSEDQKELVAKFYSDIYERLGELDEGVFDEAMGTLGDASEERATTCAEQLVAEMQISEPDEAEKKRLELENEWETEYQTVQTENNKQREAIDPLDDEFDQCYENTTTTDSSIPTSQPPIDQSELLAKIRHQITRGAANENEDPKTTFEPDTFNQQIAGLQFAFSGAPKKVIQGEQATTMQSELRELSTMMEKDSMRPEALKARAKEQKEQRDCDFPVISGSTTPVCQGELADCLKHLGVSLGDVAGSEAG